METMRERFTAVTTDLLDEHPRLAVVLADISRGQLRPARARYPDRVINVGIREQLLISVAGGLALAGMRPIAHTFASFLVERPVRADQAGPEPPGRAARCWSARARPTTTSEYGRTHQSPGDVALLDTLPGWTVHVPGIPTRPSARSARRPRGRPGLPAAVHARPTRFRWTASRAALTMLRRGSRGTVLAVGPLADAVVDATLGFDVTVLYAATVRPLDVATLRDSLQAPDVVLVEPYLAGTSVPAVAEALRDLPHRILGLGVGRRELRRYGTPAEHQAAHGLDARSLRAEIASFLRP